MFPNSVLLELFENLKRCFKTLDSLMITHSPYTSIIHSDYDYTIQEVNNIIYNFPYQVHTYDK